MGKIILHVFAFTICCCCFSSPFYFAQCRKELIRANQDHVIQLVRAVPSNTIDPSRVTTLSWQPRVFLYNGFLSNEECDHLISLDWALYILIEEKLGQPIVDNFHCCCKLSRRSLAQSVTFGLGVTLVSKQWPLEGSGNKDKSSSGNSTDAVEGTADLDISIEIEDEMTARIEERISAWTFLPKESGKLLHVLHSGLEATEENHNYMGNFSMQPGQSILATVVMYLSNVTQGGQILFPGAESGSSRPRNKILFACTTSSQITKPIKGNAMLFFNLHPNTSIDPSSSHARCPITEGDMWWATKIFVVKSVTRLSSIESETSNDDSCMDEDDKCSQWAAVGECERNPIFMVGTADYYGTCRKSCNVC